MFIFTSSLRDFRLLSAKFHSVQLSLNLRCDRKTHAKKNIYIYIAAIQIVARLQIVMLNDTLLLVKKIL